MIENSNFLGFEHLRTDVKIFKDIRQELYDCLLVIKGTCFTKKSNRGQKYEYWDQKIKFIDIIRVSS